MKYNKEYLYNMYNATSTDDGSGDLETYEHWLERQLISRIKKLEQIESQKDFCKCEKPKANYPEMIWCDTCTKVIDWKI